jgi:hypothetical protein
MTVIELRSDINFDISPHKPKREKAQRIITWSVSVAAAVALILFMVDRNGSLLPPFGTYGHDTYITQNETDTDTSDTPTPAPQKENGFNKKEASKTDDIKDPLLADNKTGTIDDSQSANDANMLPGAEAPGAGAPGLLPPSEDANIPADTLKFLAHHDLNEDLEKLVERYKENMRNESDISVISPLTITYSGNSVTIQWENSERKRLIIEVFNNNGIRILETETTEETYTITDLNESIYYWKLISANYDLLFCGRIVIE